MTAVGDCCGDRPKPRCDDQIRDNRRRYDGNLTATAIETTTVIVTHATGTTHATKTVIALPIGSMFFAIGNTPYVEKKCPVIEESDHGHSADDEDGAPLRDGLNAYLKVCYAFSGNVSFVSYMAEMTNPQKDFHVALAWLEISSYVFVANPSTAWLANIRHR
ncbi:hypothetical protein NM208_g8880 [Fusarium decemcellulare]|uniref:Uncharacterized protein n=1 Tax=Fusarium decemcellulare TaxID=57161 RepID=A0ACC1S3P9_9HYPO|nr:hypothetical protein NM208_g8880 [Fusarium decemcellulare]